jgi:hypothetical protein
MKRNRLLTAIFAVALMLVCAGQAQALDNYTWKPGIFKITAGGSRVQNPIPKLGSFYPISTLGQNTNYIFPDPGASGTATVLLAGGVNTQHITVPLTSAQLIAMYTTPVLLIPAGAAGTNIIVDQCLFTMTTTATAFTGGGVVAPQIGTTAHGAGTLTTGTIAAAVVTAGAGTSYTSVIPAAFTGTAATGLYISNQTAAFAAGTGSAVVDIWYVVK